MPPSRRSTSRSSSPPAAAAKPLLAEKMARARLRFARKNRHVTPEEWEKTMFSDESTFRLINPRAQKVRRSKQMNRYLSKFTVKTVKHPPNVMVCLGVGLFLGGGGQAPSTSCRRAPP